MHDLSRFVYDQAVDRECSEEWYSWYFGYCTREEAEIMLTNGVKYGNTLLRKKPTSETGKRRYAISKCILKDG